VVANLLFQVQIKYFQNGDTSGNTGNRCHFCFFKWKSPTLISNMDSTLNSEFRKSFCQHLSVIVFDLCHLFHKKSRLQGFIKKFVTPEPLEINDYFYKIEFPKVWPIFCVILDIFFIFHMPTAIFQN
jgi:hypothetical protein